jgi:predicted nucleotidyltransferase
MATTFVSERDTIFLTLAGSHAHGTARKDSDVDLRGVAIAPLPVKFSYMQTFEQYEGPMSTGMSQLIKSASEDMHLSLDSNKVEVVIFDIVKFFRLCAAANPNALEILFADPSAWLFDSPAWRMVFDRRYLFLSRKVCETYVGYALAQLKRIKSHRSWLLNPPSKQPTRGEFGLPELSILKADDRNRIEEAISDKLRRWALEDLEMPPATRIAIRKRLEEFWMDILSIEESGEQVDLEMRQKAALSLGLSREVIEVLERERRFRSAQKHWQSYQKWKAERNPMRANLESRYGYDTKHAMHLIRLMRTGLELVRTGDLRVRRYDADELLAIRDGKMTYEQVVEEAQHLEHLMREGLDSSPLPTQIDEDSIDELVVGTIQQFSK